MGIGESKRINSLPDFYNSASSGVTVLDVLLYIFFIYTYYYHKKYKGEIIMTLIERTNKFLDELGVTVAAFARRVRLSPQAIYGWRGGRLVLSDASLKRIEDHLSKYGF